MPIQGQQKGATAGECRLRLAIDPPHRGTRCAPNAITSNTLRTAPATRLKGESRTQMKIDTAFARYRLAIPLVLLGLAAFPHLANAQTSNGQAPRPFWNFAHNPNRMSDVDATIANGGNALEPDIMLFPNPACNSTFFNLYGGPVSPSNLYVYHDATCPTRKPDTVEDYLDHVHAAVKNGGNIALIAFDIKTKAAQPDLIKKLHDAALAHLNNGQDGVNVSILYSVGSFSDAQANGAVFSQISSVLRDNEGIQIDGENDPSIVYNTLRPQSPRIGYGNGSFGVSYGAAPNVLPSLMEGSWLRASQVKSGFMISYGFPVPVLAPATHAFDCSIPILPGCYENNLWADLITAGVDGLIPDYDVQPQIWEGTVTHIKALHDQIIASKDLYLATAADNPFTTRNQAYGLRINTREADIFHPNPGTDDAITFTLTGTCGSASVIVNADYLKIFKKGQVDYVTIHSKNLGHLTSLALSSHGTDTWRPTFVRISSAPFGIPYADNMLVNFDGQTVDNGSSASVSLGNWGYDCTPPTAAPAQSPLANAAGWNNSDVTVSWNWADKSGAGLDYTGNSCPTSTTSSGQGPITLSASCSDNVGNYVAATRQVNVDKIAPVVSCGTADGLWHPSDISIACTGSDALSGLAVAANANFSLSTSLPALTETNNAFTGKQQVFDVAGNSSTAGPIGGNKIDKKPPVITILQPAATTYTHSSTLTLNYTVTDGGSGVATVSPTMNGNTAVAGLGLSSGQAIPLLTSLALGPNTFTLNSTDNVGNRSSQSITFTIIVTAQSMIDDVNQFIVSGAVDPKGSSLVEKLNNALPKQTAGQCTPAKNLYNAFINEVQAQTGKSITPVAAAILIADAQYLQTHCP